jgi:hypothetical protein
VPFLDGFLSLSLLGIKLAVLRKPNQKCVPIPEKPVRNILHLQWKKIEKRAVQPKIWAFTPAKDMVSIDPWDILFRNLQSVLPSLHVTSSPVL